MRARNLVFLFLILFLAGCGNQYIDKSLKTKTFAVNASKIKNTQIGLTNPDLTGVYNGIDDMYADADYVLSGIVKDIQYFQVDYKLLRKINVVVNKNYKGGVRENTLISILENDGYIRLKTLYDKLKKAYEDKNGDIEKEDAWLYGRTYMSSKKEIQDDMLIRCQYERKEDSKIGDELLLFLTDTSDDTYKGKKVQMSLGDKLSYPEGAYAPLGLLMGKFTKADDSYKRYNIYSITKSDGEKNIGQPQYITESYTADKMERELARLSNK